MSFFVETEPKTFTIRDGDEEATVQIKELTAGDQASIQDSIRMQIGENTTPELKIGAFRLLLVEKALVSWTLPQPVTPNTIRALKPAVFEQIFELANGEAETPLEADSSAAKPTT